MKDQQQVVHKLRRVGCVHPRPLQDGDGELEMSPVDSACAISADSGSGTTCRLHDYTDDTFMGHARMPQHALKTN